MVIKVATLVLALAEVVLEVGVASEGASVGFGPDNGEVGVTNAEAS